MQSYREKISNNINNTIQETNFPALGRKYKGKVRDTYTIDERIVMITTDRISAFDHVLGTIPFKGQVLNQIAAWWFEKTKNVAASDLIDVPDPNVMVKKACRTVPIEVVFRGYLTGSAWRDYQAGKPVSGIVLPKGMKKDRKFDKPLLTPSTKAKEGHDIPISEGEIVKQGIVQRELWETVREKGLKLFLKGQELAMKQGLILVDTKYEFGIDKDGNVLVIDEIHTPDSSRFWIRDSYEELFKAGKDQNMLDKEFVRQWLIREKNFMGHGPLPELSNEIKISAGLRYIDLYEKITGGKFRFPEDRPVLERIQDNLRKKGYLK